MPHIAAVFGASGLIGNALIEQLQNHDAFEKIYYYSRKPPLFLVPKSVFKPFEIHRFEIEPDVDTLFCALGTTIKKAGSKAAFEKVDLHAVKQIAAKAKAAGVQTLAVVSSMGADDASKNFYLRTKGQMEQAVTNAGIPRVIIARPSLLLGERDEKRTGEDIAKAILKPLAFLMAGPLLKYRPIKASCVAAAILEAALSGKTGIQILENNQLHQLTLCEK